MKKIEAVAWIDDGGLLFVNDGIIPDGTDLYTSDALLAVAKSVRDAIHEYNGVDVSQVDIHAIINQLTGE